MYWWNGRQMYQYIGTELDKSYEEFRDVKSTDTRRRSVMDLILQAYEPTAHKPSPPSTLEASFRAFAISQIRLLLFTDHNSTSSFICYCFHSLSSHPQILGRLRSEHDSVFGTQIPAAATILEQQPNIVNSLSYTTAVIKEVLRIFPPASSVR